MKAIKSREISEDAELFTFEVHTTRAKDMIFREDGIEVEDIEKTIR